MGSAAELSGPKINTVFLEDLPPEEIAKVQEPSGLINMGNTCYLNSVVQCLRAVEPFRKGLQSLSPSVSNQNTLFLTALRDLYTSLDKTVDPIPPANFVRLTKLAFPQFSQLGQHGQPMQQDAEEFYSGLLTVAAQETQDVTPLNASAEELQGAANLVDAVFGIIMEETLICDESPQETPVVTKDLHRKLVCNIQGGHGTTTNITHVAEGIQLGLEGKIEKNSEILGRNAQWTRRQRMARLPPILVVQFGRFYWKATPDSEDHAGVKCKIMKKVVFSSIFDVFDFCTESVQTILKASRDKALKEEEDRIQKKLDGQEDVQMDDAGAEKVQDEDEELKAALAMSMESPPVGPCLPANFQGQYELFAVVTHKGRNADGGHYMGWVKASSSVKAERIADTDEVNEDWFVFDDDEVSPCKTEDILKLQGGGDYDMSYLNFYRAKK
jgi:ubiquitin carboxyl-terminal hydrolase 14